jgi:hypothetical protein
LAIIESSKGLGSRKKEGNEKGIICQEKEKQQQANKKKELK